MYENINLKFYIDVGKGNDNKLFKIKDIKPSKQKHTLDLIKLIISSWIQLGKWYGMMEQYMNELQAFDLANWFARKTLPVRESFAQSILIQTESIRKERESKMLSLRK